MLRSGKRDNLILGFALEICWISATRASLLVLLLVILRYLRACRFSLMETNWATKDALTPGASARPSTILS